MKRLLAIIPAVCLVFSLSACSVKKPAGENAADITTVAESGTGEPETTPATTTEPEETSEEQSEEPSGTTTGPASSETSVTTTTSSGTPKPTAKPKPEVKVTNAVKKKLKTGKGKKDYVYHYIPKITIKNVDTKKVNAKIKKDLAKTYFYDKSSGEYGGSYTTYSYCSKGDVLSIEILYHAIGYDGFGWKAYNISISTGKFLTKKQVLKKLGLSEKKFMKKVRKTYKIYKKDVGRNLDSWGKKYMKKSMSKYTKLKYITPYVGDKGHLCFIGYIYLPAATHEEVKLSFDTTKKREVAGIRF